MPEPSMPDPWGPPSIVSLDVHEAPIREVLSRLDGLTGQLSEYAAAAIRDGATSTEDARTLRAIEILSGAALEALIAWDRWLTAQRAPEAPDHAFVMRPGGPVEDGCWHYFESGRKCMAEKADHPAVKLLRHRTPDQVALAETHRRLQGGG